MAVQILVVSLLVILLSALIIPQAHTWISPTSDQWEHADTLIGIATFAFAVGAGIIVLAEFRETIDSRNLDIYRDIYERFMGDEQIESRRYIYSHKIPEEMSEEEIAAVTQDKEAQTHIKHVLNVIDYFGFLVEQDWVTGDEIIGWLSPVVVKVWAKIGPIVEYERQQRKEEEPDYYLAAVQLAEACKRWRDRHYPNREAVEFDPKRL